MRRGFDISMRGPVRSSAEAGGSSDAPAPRASAGGPVLGFTLLEVTVALAILALGLTAIVDINTGAAKLHEASQHLTLATLLARSKMVDLEDKLDQEGFSDFDKEIDGNFDDEHHPEIKWKAEILKPDLTKATDQITALITGAMGGGGTGGSVGGGALGTNSALASLLGQSSLMPSQLPEGMSSLGSSSSSDGPSNPTASGLGGLLGGAANGLIQSQVQMLVQQLQQGVREVRLTVIWNEGRHEESFTVTTHLVVLNPTGPGTSSTTPYGQSTNPAGSGAPNQMPGMPGAMGMPGSLPMMPGNFH